MGHSEKAIFTTSLTALQDFDKYPTKLEVNNSFMENKNIFSKVKRIEVSFTPTEACQFSNIKVNGS